MSSNNNYKLDRTRIEYIKNNRERKQYFIRPDGIVETKRPGIDDIDKRYTGR